MAQFSSKERLIAKTLSSAPALKRVLKRAYVSLNYLLHYPKNNFKITSRRIKGLNLIASDNPRVETFYGYYDKSPENSAGLILFNATRKSTKKKPDPLAPLSIEIVSRDDMTVQKLAKSTSYNWQQGARAQWIDDNRIIMNYYDAATTAYRSKVVDVHTASVASVYARPVQDAFGSEFFLSINYERVMRLRPDYGYRNKALLSDKQMEAVAEDGIWKVDMTTGEGELIHSLKEIITLHSYHSAQKVMHKVNHVMISPNGTRFIFISRVYDKGTRHDCLMLSDFKQLRVLCNEDMVSHMCWVDEKTLFGYLRHGGENGFFFVNLDSLEFVACESLNKLGFGDGHPTVHGNSIVVDTYPDKGGMQHLILYDIQSGQVEELLQVKHPPMYFGESRCDMHPRFSPQGDRIYFDTVFSGRRSLGYADLATD